MELQEHPLLHFADLMLAVLKASRDRPATLDDAARLLARHRHRAGETQAVDPRELAVHLAMVLAHAEAALLAEPLGSGRFRATPRGRHLLAAHPGGIDDSVLMEFPEFRAWLAKARPPHRREDTRAREFLGGFISYDQGSGLTDNPFATDTAQHAAWEDGWLAGERRSREGNAPQPDGRRR